MDFDIDTAKQAIDVARQGATTLNSAIGAIDRLKTLFKSPEPPPMDEVRETITGLREQIVSARETNISLRETIGDLRDELIELKRSQEKFSGYELWKTPSGSVVYRSSEDIEPVHYLCPSCHDAGVKTLLQGHKYTKTCRATPSHGSFGFEVRPPSPSRTRRRIY